jgi:hypothetical protein
MTHAVTTTATTEALARGRTARRSEPGDEDRDPGEPVDTDVVGAVTGSS